MNRYKVAKHFKLDIQADSFNYERKCERIERPAALDGLCLQIVYNRLQICMHEAAAVSRLQIFYSVGCRIFSDGSDGQKLESRHLHSAS